MERKKKTVDINHFKTLFIKESYPQLILHKKKIKFATLSAEILQNFKVLTKPYAHF